VANSSQELREWVSALADAIETYKVTYQQKGVKKPSGNDLARLCGISEGAWGNIARRSGAKLTNRVNYVRVMLRLGINMADPRTIPEFDPMSAEEFEEAVLSIVKDETFVVDDAMRNLVAGIVGPVAAQAYVNKHTSADFPKDQQTANPGDQGFPVTEVQAFVEWFAKQVANHLSDANEGVVLLPEPVYPDRLDVDSLPALDEWEVTGPDDLTTLVLIRTLSDRLSDPVEWHTARDRLMSNIDELRLLVRRLEDLIAGKQPSVRRIDIDV